jgi:DNA invertase Pin-like site-specific DNA recombinase
MFAIYARVSTSEQNPEAQLLALREYAARRGFCIYKETAHVVGDDGTG